MITVEIGGKQYDLELDRRTYVKMLKDKEYSEVQNELVKSVGTEKNKAKQAKIIEENINETLANELIITEKVFYYSLLKYNEGMTPDIASELLDIAIEECGFEQVTELTNLLISSFTIGASEKESKKTLIVNK